MFTRNKSDLPGNRVQTNRALLNRPTMDSKKNVNLRSTNSTLKKAFPLTSKTDSNVGESTAKRKLLLDVKEQNPSNSKTTVNGGAKGKLTKPEPNSSSTKSSSKSFSVIDKKGGMKDRLESIEKKKKDFREKVKEVTEKKTQVDEEIAEIKSSQTESIERFEKAKVKLEEARKKHEEVMKQFNLMKTDVDSVLINLNQLKEKDVNEEQMIEDLESQIKQNEEEKSKQNDKTVKLQTCSNENIRTIANLSNNLKTYQKFGVKSFLENTRLYNDICNMKGIVQVFCKVRPLLSEEKKESVYSINYIDECTINAAKSSLPQSMMNSKMKPNKKEFVFDKVFPPSVPVNVLFEDMSCFVRSAIEGQKICMFIYGPEKSGKSYTLEGPEDNRETGLLYLMADYIFESMKNRRTMGSRHTITLNCAEIIEDKANEICKTEIKTPEDLIENYFKAKQNRKCDRNSPFVVDICIAEFELREYTGVIKIVELPLTNILPENTMLAIQELAQNKYVDALQELSHIFSFDFNLQSKVLVILNIVPILDKYSECLKIMKFGSEVVACRMKQKS